MGVKLKLCPFCGNVPEIRFEEYCGDYLSSDPWKMYCCILEIDGFKSLGELVNAWNGRADDAEKKQSRDD